MHCLVQTYWSGPPDLKRRRERLEAINRELGRTRGLTQPKLREQVGGRVDIVNIISKVSPWGG